MCVNPWTSAEPSLAWPSGAWTRGEAMEDGKAGAGAAGMPAACKVEPSSLARPSGWGTRGGAIDDGGADTDMTEAGPSSSRVGAGGGAVGDDVGVSNRRREGLMRSFSSSLDTVLRLLATSSKAAAWSSSRSSENWIRLPSPKIDSPRHSSWWTEGGALRNVTLAEGVVEAAGGSGTRSRASETTAAAGLVVETRGDSATESSIGVGRPTTSIKLLESEDPKKKRRKRQAKGGLKGAVGLREGWSRGTSFNSKKF